MVGAVRSRNERGKVRADIEPMLVVVLAVIVVFVVFVIVECTRARAAPPTAGVSRVSPRPVVLPARAARRRCHRRDIIGRPPSRILVCLGSVRATVRCTEGKIT